MDLPPDSTPTPRANQPIAHDPAGLLSPDEYRMHQRMHDFRFYARHNFRITTKSGGEEYLEFNSAQEIIHAAAEKQLAEIGMVRLIIVKGRQQGCSTYIAGRFYHKAAMKRAQTVCILSHEAKSTKALFRKVKYANKYIPPAVAPGVDKDNTTELTFPNDSRYIVSTAGSENSGRSETAQFMHASEVAFFDMDEELTAGAFQIVADIEGTEIFKESTANGYNGFHKTVIAALRGKSLWRVVFIPWFVQKEYRLPIPSDFELTDEESRLKRIYNLDDNQIMWRRNKLEEPAMTSQKFKQEYPCYLMEAFQSSEGTFFSGEKVQEARHSHVRGKYGALVLGVDPGRNHDRTIIAMRRGREVIKLWKYDDGKMNEMRLANILKNIIDKYGVDKCFIDYGQGYGTYDKLVMDGYGSVVEGVHFKETASRECYSSKRTEIMFNFRDWLEAPGGCKLPDDDDMAADIASMPPAIESGNGVFSFPKKSEIKKTYGRSPDILDAIALTFAYPVRVDDTQDEDDDEDYFSRKRRQKSTVNTEGGSALRGRRRVSGDWGDNGRPLRRSYGLGRSGSGGTRRSVIWHRNIRKVAPTEAAKFAGRPIVA